MVGIKRAFGMFSGLLALAALGGCLTGDDSEKASNFSLSNEIEITNIEEPDTENGEPGILSTLSLDYSCMDEEAVAHEYEGTLHYAFTSGFLYLWYSGECTAIKFEGSSSRIQGTWTATDLSVRIPSAYRPTECESTTPYETYLERILDKPSVTYTISSSRIKAKVTGTFCMAPVLAYQYGGPDADVVSSSCSSVKLKNEDGRTATLSMTYNGKDDTAVETIAYNGRTCRMKHSMGLSDAPPSCSEEASDDFVEQMVAFQECMEDSDFYSDFGYGVVERTASGLPLSLEKAFDHSRSF